MLWEQVFLHRWSVQPSFLVEVVVELEFVELGILWAVVVVVS